MVKDGRGPRGVQCSPRSGRCGKNNDDFLLRCRVGGSSVHSELSFVSEMNDDEDEDDASNV